MNTDFTAIDRDFSPELRALMGEWVTYFVVHSYNRQQRPEIELSDRAYFESQAFNPTSGGPYNEYYHFFEEVNLIVSTDQRYQNRSTCAYPDVWQVIYSSIPKMKYSLISYFFDAATDWQGSPLTPSEREAFTIDAECAPLFQRLTDEGFVRQAGQRFHWTHKIRPYLEYRNMWSPRDAVDTGPDVSWVADMPEAFKLHLADAVSRRDKISAVQLLKEWPDLNGRFTLVTAIDCVEAMYPEIWGKQEAEVFHWKWFGEIPSQMPG